MTANSWRTPFNWHNIPLIGKWGTRIGKIDDIMAFPCNSTTPYIWVKAFVNGAMTAFVSPLSMSCLDYLIIRLGGGHGLFREFKWDVWAFEFLPKVGKPGIGWFFIAIESIGARALWYIALADAFTEGVLNWVSLAYQYAGCRYPGEPRALCSIVPGGVVTPGSDFYISVWGNDESYIFGAGGGGITVNPGYNPTLGVEIGWAEDPLHPLNFSVPSVTIEDVTDGGVVPGYEDHSVAWSNGGHSSGMTYSAGLQLYARTYRVHIVQGAGYAAFTYGHFQAYGAIHRDHLGFAPCQ